MEKEKKKRGGMLASALVSLLFGFTVCFFPPAETYLNNPMEFHLSASHVLPPLLLTALIVSAGCFLLLRLLNRLHQTASRAGQYLIFGVTLAGYIQMMFYNGKVGKLDGVTNLLDISMTYTYVNWFVFLLILLLPLILYALAQKKPESALGKVILNKKTLPFLCGTMILMQAAGFASLVPKISSTSKIENHQSYLSYAPAITMSEDENIVVFLTDRLDGEWFDQMLELDPSLYDALDGFTYYRNNVSNFTFTFPSAPYMISGISYPETGIYDVKEFFNYIWSQDHNMMRVLHDSGWNTNLLFEQISVFGELENIEDYADNIASTVKPPAYNYIRNSAGIIPSFINLSLFRMTPYLLKEMFDYPIAPDYYTIYDMDLPDKQMNDVCPESDIDLYEYLESTPVHTGSDKKTASFFHLNCAHNSDENLAALCPAVPQGSFDPVTTSCGSFMIIRRFLDQLKEAGIYDNTTFIIIADHGRFPEETAKMGSNELGDAITGTLIIKPAGAEHGRLQIDSEAEMSNQFFPASILEYAGLPHDQFGLSYQDVLTDHLHPERTIYMTYGHKKELEPETEPRRKKYRITTTNCYTITGDARDFSNWVFHVNNADYS